jgi:DNA-binding NarL/FixJ family response regulator
MRKCDDKHNRDKLIRVVIVEDNNYMREGWATVLDSDSGICVINTFNCCEDALENGSYQNADIMILDIGLPGMSGTEGVLKFLEQTPSLSIVMATILEDNKNVFTALQNGAVGYLMKNVTPDGLIQAVKEANSGGSPMSPNIARKVIASLQTKSGSIKKYELNERETVILQLLGEGKSYSAIAKEVYLSVDGVGYHIRNIYRKLQVKKKSQAIAKGVAAGLIKLN